MFHSLSCAKIIDDHEQRQTQEKEKFKEKAKETEKPKETEKAKEQQGPSKTKKKPDITEVLKSASPVNDDLDFTFGGPAGTYSVLRKTMVTLHYRRTFHLDNKNEIPGKNLLKEVKFKNWLEKCCNMWKIQPYKVCKFSHFCVTCGNCYHF